VPTVEWWKKKEGKKKDRKTAKLCLADGKMPIKKRSELQAYHAHHLSHLGTTQNK